jgi:dihydroflavonol-4-reductase
MILVTGGAGLLGSTLIKMLLANGKIVRATFNKTSLQITAHPNFSEIQCDILDVFALEEAMENITEVYHCAAIVSFAPKDAQKLYKINVEGTANIVNACLDGGVRKLVHVSSVAALGRAIAGTYISESTTWADDASTSLYGHSKYLGELEVWRGVAEGLNAVVINPSIILGAGNWNEGSTKLFKSVYDGFPYYTTGTNGFVDVADVAAIMIQLMEADITAERFIVSAENITYQYLLNNIATTFGKKLPSKKVTPFLAAITWRLEAIKSKFTNSQPLITKETARTSLSATLYDNSKLLKMLPSFSYKTIKTTVENVCEDLLKKYKI